MKLIRNSLVLAGVLVAGLSMGQSSTQVNLESLKVLHREIRSAYRTIQSCMPIYEGHRGVAMNALHEAEVAVRGVIVANEPPQEAKPAVAIAAPVAPKPVEKPANEKAKLKEAPKKGKEEAPKAAPVPAPKPVAATVPAAAPKTPEELKAEEMKKVITSQVRFRHGLELVQKAIQDLKAVESSLPADQAAKLAKLLQTAEAESTKSIEVHAKEG